MSNNIPTLFNLDNPTIKETPIKKGLQPYWSTDDGNTVKLYNGDALHVLRQMPCRSVQTVVTSPPYYGLRDYDTATWKGGDSKCDHSNGFMRNDSQGGKGDKLNGAGVAAPSYYRDKCGKCGAKRIDQQIGSEATPEEFIKVMVNVFHEVRRVLRNDGTLWINLGDSYGNGKCGGESVFANGRTDGRSGDGGIGRTKEARKFTKERSISTSVPSGNLLGIPWRVALALQADGWILRQDIIWSKPSPMPESVRNRCTKAHEYLFMFTKSTDYYCDMEAIKEPLKVSDEDYLKMLKAKSNSKHQRIGTSQNGGAGRKEDGPNAYYEDNKDKLYVPNGSNRRTVWEVEDHKSLFYFLQENNPELLSQYLDSIGNKYDIFRVSSQGYAGAHFATYPPKLIEPCIKAGTSEYGACVECGAPWERTTESNRVATRPDKSSKYGTPEDDIRGGSETLRKRMLTNNKTLGWKPTCHCKSDKVRPCIVLDPFIGSGTSCEVAIENNRWSIGIDLSTEYLTKNAIPRIESVILREPVRHHLLKSKFDKHRDAMKKLHKK